MKVLHVIPSLWHGDGGPSEALAVMERALSAQGVQVETATTDDAGPGRRASRPLGEPVPENGVIRRYFRKRTDLYKAAPAFARWIDAHVGDYDLLHIHALFSFTTAAAARAARRQRVPYIMRPLGTLDAWSLAHRRRGLKRLSLRWVEGPLLRAAAAVHFTSAAEAQQAAALRIPMRAAVVPLAVPDPPTSPRTRAPADGELRVLYLSRLALKKNVEGLLDAFALLVREFPQLRLLLAGDGEPAYVAALRTRAQALGIDGRIEWLGRVEGDAKERAFGRADCFALPSRSENFGIAAAEALARGLPCLLGEGVAIAADVRAAGAGITVGTSPEEIAAGLKLMIPAQTRAEMSLRASELARERFSPHALGVGLKALYTEILTGRHGLPPEH